MKERSALNARQFCSIAFMGSAVTAMLLQTVSVLFFYEDQTNYFQKGAVLPLVAVVFLLLSVVSGTLLAYLSHSSGDPTSKYRFAPLFPSIGFAVSGVELLLNATSTTETVCAIFLISSSIYSVLAFLNLKNLTNLTIWLCFLPIFSFALLTARHYFDFTVEMNAPLKLMLQCGLLCSMLFYTGELRIHLNNLAPRMYRMLCVWTVASASFASIPTIMAYFTGKTDRVDFLFMGILLLGVGSTALLRLISIQSPVISNSDDTDSTI